MIEGDSLRCDAATLDRLLAYVKAHCYCPCCEQDMDCLEGCTFATDSPGEAERMNEARSVLYPIILRRK